MERSHVGQYGVVPLDQRRIDIMCRSGLQAPATTTASPRLARPQRQSPPLMARRRGVVSRFPAERAAVNQARRNATGKPADSTGTA